MQHDIAEHPRLLVAASNNRHKLTEIIPLVAPDFRIVTLRDIGCEEELEETQDTLEGNSLQKARYIFEKYNHPCFADDTGLEVDALNGAPGVYSARYAGEQRNSGDNIALLLKNLKDESNRSARFRTVITLIDDKGYYTFEGIVRGVITHDLRGEDGFGYDPVFQPEGFSRTFAEMTIDEKNQLSHRGQAIRKLVAFLKSS